MEQDFLVKGLVLLVAAIFVFLIGEIKSVPPKYKKLSFIVGLVMTVVGAYMVFYLGGLVW